NREYYATWFTSGTIGSTAILTVRNNGVIKKVSLHRIKRDDYYDLRGKVVRVPAIPPLYPPYCKILEGNIGYLRVHRVYTKELDSLAGMLKNCKRIILDARGYPRDGMIAFHLASYIADKTDTVDYNVFPFIVSPDLSENYLITEYEVIRPNKNPELKDKKYYILVDEGNQSQSEGGVIALQGVTNATTIGTQTAGANGMAVTINFPGEYMSFFSGFGEYYMDHTPNQKLGVKIDVQVHRTLDGYIKGRDEIIEKALEIAGKP
ncbi:MAG TPA: S41 family peptidase, partial [Pedobacter sp.]